MANAKTEWDFNARPTYGRFLHCEVLEEVYDWKSFFRDWPFKISGHVQTHHQTEAGERAVHVFKFCRREELSEGVEVQTTFNASPHPLDIIMMTKQYLGSSELSQVQVSESWLGLMG